MTQTRIGFINEHGMNLEELSARTVVTNCAGDFVDDFDMDAVEDDYEAAREAVIEAVRSISDQRLRVIVRGRDSWFVEGLPGRCRPVRRGHV